MENRLGLGLADLLMLETNQGSREPRLTAVGDVVRPAVRPVSRLLRGEQAGGHPNARHDSGQDWGGGKAVGGETGLESGT